MGKGKILDLRWQGRLGADLTLRFDQLATEMRDNFHSAICSLSRGHVHNLDWWLSSALSRNIFASPLFFRVCAFQLVCEQLASKEVPSRILVDSAVLGDAISDTAAQAGLAPTVEVQRSRRLPSILIGAGLFLRACWLWCLVRLFTANHTAGSKQPLTLVDTFVSPGYEKTDRYYPGLLENLDAAVRKSVLRVPTLYGYTPTGYVSVLRILDQCTDAWLFREHFLRLQDMFYAALWWWRVQRLPVPEENVAGIDLGLLIREELQEYRDPGAAFAGILNYRFFQRLSENHIDLLYAVDWHENQPLDRGWNAGLNHFYPDTPTMGYQGYIVSPHYLVMYPLACERAAGLLPKAIGVMGEGYVDERRRYCPESNMEPAPSFRFGHIYRQRQAGRQTDGPAVAVALPKDTTLANDIISMVRREASIKPAWIWRIKTHPTHTAEKTMAWCTSLPGNVTCYAGILEDLLDECDVLLGSASSACMEAVACGLGVIIVAGDRGLIQNPIPDDVDHQLWKIFCYGDDLTGMLDELMVFIRTDPGRMAASAGQVRERYFRPVTRTGVEKFMRQ